MPTSETSTTWLLVLTMLGAVLMVALSPVTYTGSDPRGTLLLSHSIITHGTLELDHYGSDVLDRYGAVIQEKNGHQYYYFPIGTALISAPVVAAAHVLGVDVLANEDALQVLVACITAALTLLLLTRLASLFLTPVNGLLMAATFWFGSSLASTGGTALWSHNIATLAALAAIYYSVKGQGKDAGKHWATIGTLLFVAYLCRPTMALLAPFVLLFVFSNDRKAAIKSGLILAVWLAVFVGLSYREFGQLLPDYYLPKRLSGGDFTRALYGNLFSPARGLLVFSPFIVAAWLCYSPRQGNFRLEKTWLLIGLAWPLLHVIFISRFPHWWAGHSYGARFMMDVLPGLFLLTLRAWPRGVSGRYAAIPLTVLAATVLFSVYVNAWQGLFNTWTAQWNREPDVDSYSFYLFDWRYPQFLHNEASHHARLAHHNSQMDVGNPLLEISYDQVENVHFEGWDEAESLHRWSIGHAALIHFRMADTEAVKGVLAIDASYYGAQQIVVKLNGTLLESYSSRQVSYPKRIRFDPRLLRVDKPNTLEFEFPGTEGMNSAEDKVLTLALRKIAIL